MFRKIDQGPQGLWLGLKGFTDGAKGYSLPQEIEKAREASYFSSIFIFTTCNGIFSTPIAIYIALLYNVLNKNAGPHSQ